MRSRYVFFENRDHEPDELPWYPGGVWCRTYWPAEHGGYFLSSRMDRFLDTSEDTHFHVPGPRKSIKKRTEKKRKAVPESRLQSRASFRAGEARVLTGNGVTGSEATVGRAYISNSNPTKSLHPPRNFRGDLFFTLFHLLSPTQALLFLPPRFITRPFSKFNPM